MRVIISLILVGCLALFGCSTPSSLQTVDSSSSSQAADVPEIADLSDPALINYLEYSIYSDIIEELDSDEYYVENIEAVYVSKEYIEELESNSQENIYFGYTLSDVIAAFDDTPYVFTVNNEGQTIVVPFEEYYDVWNEVMQNIAVGSGVILVCVTVSAVTGGAGMPVASAIFAVSAETGTMAALSGGAISGVMGGIATAAETHDLDATLKSTALSASEGYKIGAIIGAATGAAGEGLFLKDASKKTGLSPQTVAKMQRESKYPPDVIMEFTKDEQYQILRDANVRTEIIDGRTALTRDIDLNYTKDGITNAQRMAKGKAPLDPTGKEYELHHLNQNPDGTLAILTKQEHMQNGNNKIWHIFDGTSVPKGADWAKQKSAFWKDFVKKAA